MDKSGPPKNRENKSVEKVCPKKVETKQCAKSSLHKRRSTHRRAVVAVVAAVAVAAMVMAVVTAAARAGA